MHSAIRLDVAFVDGVSALMGILPPRTEFPCGYNKNPHFVVTAQKSQAAASSSSLGARTDRRGQPATSEGVDSREQVTGQNASVATSVGFLRPTP